MSRHNPRRISRWANWQATKKFSLGTNYTTNRSEGGENSDSATDTISTNAHWTPTTRMKYDGYWFHQVLTYLDTVGGSHSDMIGLNTQLGPYPTFFQIDDHSWPPAPVG